MGVWIEIESYQYSSGKIGVTPLVGVWIEICNGIANGYATFVTPLVGVWIEIEDNCSAISYPHCHSPCGSVD